MQGQLLVNGEHFGDASRRLKKPQSESMAVAVADEVAE